MDKKQIELMVETALNYKAQMEALAETSKDVAHYLDLEESRKEQHKKIKKHVTRYGVNPDNYPGLVAYEQEGVSAKKLRSLLEEIEGETIPKQNILSLFYSFWKAYTR